MSLVAGRAPRQAGRPDLPDSPDCHLFALTPACRASVFSNAVSPAMWRSLSVASSELSVQRLLEVISVLCSRVERVARRIRNVPALTFC